MPDIALDFKYLSYALAAAEHGSFRKAALAMDVPQSTVSRRVQLLERRLGGVLFERQTSGVRLTAEGDRFLRNAVQAAEHLRKAVSTFGAAQHAALGDLKLGLLVSLSTGFLAELIAEYRRRYPNVEIIIVEETARTNIASVLAGCLDAAFVTGVPETAGCEAKPLWIEPIYAALPAAHRLAEISSLTWDDLREETFIVSATGPGPEIEDHIISRLAAPGFHPAIQHHSAGRENLMNLVAKGFGLTLTTSSTLATRYAGVVFRPLAGDDEFVLSSLLWSASNVNPALRRLIQLGEELRAVRG